MIVIAVNPLHLIFKWKTLWDASHVIVMEMELWDRLKRVTQLLGSANARVTWQVDSVEGVKRVITVSKDRTCSAANVSLHL